VFVLREVSGVDTPKYYEGPPCTSLYMAALTQVGRWIANTGRNRGRDGIVLTEQMYYIGEPK
jgi:hypothetical protein